MRLSLGFKDLELAGGVFLGRNLAGCDVVFSELKKKIEVDGCLMCNFWILGIGMVKVWWCCTANGTWVDDVKLCSLGTDSGGKSADNNRLALGMRLLRFIVRILALAPCPR